MDAIDYPGIDGFLGTRATLVLDLLVLSMVGVLLVLVWSVYQVKYRRRYRLHKWVQVVLGVVLLVALVVFEVDIRLHGWTDRAAGEIGGKVSPTVWTVLYIHLAFAIAAVVVWPVVVIRALRRFPNPPAPGEHSQSHILWAQIASLLMTLTAVTGWAFYALAFAI